MSIIKRRLDTYEIDMTCDACCKGQMRSTGNVLLSDPLKYPHKCNHCGHTEVYECVYPHEEYEYVYCGDVVRSE